MRLFFVVSIVLVLITIVIVLLEFLFRKINSPLDYELREAIVGQDGKGRDDGDSLKRSSEPMVEEEKKNRRLPDEEEKHPYAHDLSVEKGSDEVSVERNDQKRIQYSSNEETSIWIRVRTRTGCAHFRSFRSLDWSVFAVFATILLLAVGHEIAVVYSPSVGSSVLSTE